MLFISLNAFFASKRINPQYYMDELESQIYWTLCTSTSIPTFDAAQTWSCWHALVASGPTTFRKYLAKRSLQVYPNVTGRMTGFLSNVIRRIDINVQFFLLYFLNFKSHPYRSPESIPMGPELPDSFHATGFTTSSMIYTEIEIGVSLYTSTV